MFTHIIVPLDGTAESTVAVTQACAIVGLTGARMTLLRVYSGGTPTPETLEYLQQAAHGCSSASASIDVAVLGGDPVEVILQQIEERQADLVVMRTRGRSGLARAVLGSVAEGVVSRSPVPTLLLPPEAVAATQMQTILVPLDGSPAGTLALGTAHVLARATGARLVLRQIVVPASSYMVHASAVHSAVYLDPRWDEDAVRGAREYIQALTGHLSGEGLQCEGDVLIEDSVADALVRIASEQRADLIVMSTEAHTGAARAILGSVTDAVVRGSSSPVLVLRRDAA